MKLSITSNTLTTNYDVPVNTITNCTIPNENWWEYYPYFCDPAQNVYYPTTFSWIYSCTKHKFRTKQVDNKFIVSIDLPGIELKDINLSLDGNNLSIKATRKDPVETISKSLFILGEWDTSSAQASLDNGVLFVSFDKNKENKKEIKIKQGK